MIILLGLVAVFAVVWAMFGVLAMLLCFSNQRLYRTFLEDRSMWEAWVSALLLGPLVFGSVVVSVVS